MGGGNGWGETGLLRMFSGVSGGMVSWLIPAGLLLSAGAIFVAVRGRTTPAPTDPAASATDGRRVQTPSQALLGAAIGWLGWLVVTAVTFSFMAGIYHDYYTVALAPAIGGTVAVGGAAVWAHRGEAWARLLLGGTSIVTGVWALALLMQAGSWYTALGWAAFAVATAAGIAMIWADRLPRALAAGVLVAALGAGLVGPYAYSINTASTAHTGSIVTAGPVSGMGGGRGGGFGGRGPGGGPGQAPVGQGSTGTAPVGGPPGGFGRPGAGLGGLLNGAEASSELVGALQADGSSYTWVAATTGAQNAASYQLASGYSVMAIGGFNGSDPSPTLEQFQADVAQGKIHYYIGGSVGRSAGGSETASEIATWVSENFTATTIGGTTVYDLTRAN